MVVSSIIPKEYGFVTASCVGLGYLLLWQTLRVGSARKAAGIKYPQMYATQEEQKASQAGLVFNCTQRAHQNTLENAPFLLFSTLFTGLLYPRFAAGAMATFVAARVAYTLGYSTGDPAKRQYGIFGSLAGVSLLLGSTLTAYRILVDGYF